jgi:hypothetical protein
MSRSQNTEPALTCAPQQLGVPTAGHLLSCPDASLSHLSQRPRSRAESRSLRHPAAADLRCRRRGNLERSPVLTVREATGRLRQAPPLLGRTPRPPDWRGWRVRLRRCARPEFPAHVIAWSPMRSCARHHRRGRSNRRRRRLSGCWPGGEGSPTRCCLTPKAAISLGWPLC